MVANRPLGRHTQKVLPPMYRPCQQSTGVAIRVMRIWPRGYALPHGAAIRPGRYSADVPEQTPNARLRAALPWFAAAAVVLALAVTAGFVTAYLVASGRAVDAPDVAAGLPTPRAAARITLAPGETATPATETSLQPRRTPTPAPVVTPEPTPFEHVIGPGESLRYIAGLYCTTVDAIVDLNGIVNPNRILVGDVLLIPGGGCPPPTPE